MRRTLLFVVVAALALAIPMGVLASDDPLLDAYNETATALGATPTSSLGGADVAVGNALGKPCVPGVPQSQPTPIVPNFCNFGAREIHFAGASSINGGVAGGMLRVTNPANGVTVQGHVICVTANGNVATIGAEVQQSDNPMIPPGTVIFHTVVDNGRPGDPVPDLFSLIFFNFPMFSAVDGQCVGVAPPPYFAVVDGDIMVRDGQVSGP